VDLRFFLPPQAPHPATRYSPFFPPRRPASRIRESRGPAAADRAALRAEALKANLVRFASGTVRARGTED
jgi:hypothetical protein